jgi:branched-chain amino acid aminotransferase
MTAKLLWLDGALVPWDEATLHVSSHGLHYGIGFFEGVRCYSTPDGPAIFRLSDHLRRLARSAATYLVQLPYPLEELAEACRAVVRENGLEACYLRPIVFLGEGPSPVAAPFRTAVIALADFPLLATSAQGGGAQAKVVSFQRMAPNAIPPAAKATGQYLNSYLAQTEALTSGYDEAILLNAHGYVTDGWAHNLFVVCDGVLRTPPVADGALPGIVRATVLTLAAEADIPAREERLVRTDLYHAEECFLTGTAAGIVPVVTVDRRPVGAGRPGPLTERLAARFADVTGGRVADHPEWREAVL